MTLRTPDQELRLTRPENLTSIQSYLLTEEKKHPHATGQLTWILSAISLSAKVIASKVRRARLEDVLGNAGTDNVQGEAQQKLDVIANETLLRCLGSRAGVAVVASEENEEPLVLSRSPQQELRYVVLFDPLDGSSNLDVNGGVGTIFSILRHQGAYEPDERSALQAGIHQVAAGYVLYGPSTVLVLTTGAGVQMFVLDPTIGSFLLVEADVRVPAGARSYSVNEAYCAGFPAGYRRYLDWAHANGYSSRYAGAMVADVHRILLQGGVFLYPPTVKAPEGKLRLMYEANPMALILEQAGGKAHAGKERILEIEPRALHQRTSVVLGSAGEVDRVLERL